jgi:hypothetical protein
MVTFRLKVICVELFLNDLWGYALPIVIRRFLIGCGLEEQIHALTSGFAELLPD